MRGPRTLDLQEANPVGTAQFLCHRVLKPRNQKDALQICCPIHSQHAPDSSHQTRFHVALARLHLCIHAPGMMAEASVVKVQDKDLMSGSGCGFSSDTYLGCRVDPLS